MTVRTWLHERVGKGPIIVAPDVVDALSAKIAW